MSAAAQVVSADGYIAAAARCNDGFPAHGNFRTLLMDHASPQALLDTILAPGFSLYDQWEAQILANIRLKARVGLLSEIADDEVRRAHLEPVGDVASAVAAERQRLGGDAPVAVLPEGPMTIPYLCVASRSAGTEFRPTYRSYVGPNLVRARAALHVCALDFPALAIAA